MSQKSSALSILFEGGEGPLQIEFTALPPKNHNLFCEIWNEKGIGPLDHNAKYSTRGGERVKRAKRGGAEAPLYSLYMNQVICKRYDNKRNT
jgi:hypothetical protein